MSSSASRAHDIDWTGAVARVVWLPPEHSTPTAPAWFAMRTLRCTERSYRDLVDLGLPTVESADGPLHDPLDLRNVALASRTRLTEVEVAMAYLLDFLRAGPAELTSPLDWRWSMVLDAEGPREVRRLCPEAFGGRLHHSAGLDSADIVDTVNPTGAGATIAMEPGVVRGGGITTCGALHDLRNREARLAMDALCGSGVRWQYLPASLEAQPALATSLGVGSCATLAATLLDQLTRLGLEAQARRGWLAAPSQIEHGWVELLDEDGQTKCLDPSLALLAADGFGTPEVEAMTYGSMLNRVVPTTAQLHEPFVVDGQPADSLRFSCSGIRRAAGPPPPPAPRTPGTRRSETTHP